MREYEILFVTEINDSLHEKAKEHVKSILQNYNVEIFDESEYGIYTLSYPIRKVNQGKYYYYHFRCDGKSLSAIEKELRYELSILRFIIVRLDEIIEKQDSKKAIRRKKRAEMRERNRENNNNEEEEQHVFRFK
ncbi:30S ribosomal protein S6 [Brachyspira aalborgi]|uniref:Small ribosomal subunit protein bS6 n=1 Tax=Brachyspira aalborgi TaxID=29522 RepID=A0A5C8ENN2_9SPIR|nr:30S ribosomal protein S6 [Brachyspira aalborgi]TXJ37790.1 30S ribosomal protein S6 [Brachyspira aalborgi]TXJ60724.1 30S ribosomal protein S6 [Brachyspira aalborgi]